MNGILSTGRALAALLVLATSSTLALLAAEPAAVPASGGIILEDFASLNGWKVYGGAWGAKASFNPAESAPPGAPGALRGKFPGILYKELSADQCRESANWKDYARLSFWVNGDGS